MGLDSTLYKRHLIRGNNVKVIIEIDGKPCETINLEAIGTIILNGCITESVII